jgi:glycosyltransferase involved in cell wall biosynthesis
MPALMQNEGFDVELWGVADQTSAYSYHREGLGTVPIKLFKTSKSHRNTKLDFSLELIEYAKEFDTDLFVLKGVDGGAGVKLLDKYIVPEQKPFIFVIGGKFYNRYVHKAAGIFYETDYQKEKLMNPGWKLTRKSIDEEKLIQLPKSVDTDLFEPMLEMEKNYDIISAGRLIPHYKNYDALGVLSEQLNVGLIGDGPLKNELKSKYPKLDLIGTVSYDQVPKYLNKGKLFFHAGIQDFFPRVIPEAMATGLPAIGFKKIISKEVIPEDCGLRLNENDFIAPIMNLLKDAEKLRSYSENARPYTVKKFGIYSSLDPMIDMLQRLNVEFQDEKLD